jgi:hypothetical protein
LYPGAVLGSRGDGHPQPPQQHRQLLHHSPLPLPLPLPLQQPLQPLPPPQPPLHHQPLFQPQQPHHHALHQPLPLSPLSPPASALGAGGTPLRAPSPHAEQPVSPSQPRQPSLLHYARAASPSRAPASGLLRRADAKVPPLAELQGRELLLPHRRHPSPTALERGGLRLSPEDFSRKPATRPPWEEEKEPALSPGAGAAILAVATAAVAAGGSGAGSSSPLGGSHATGSAAASPNSRRRTYRHGASLVTFPMSTFKSMSSAM